ncbi:cytochrome C and Quinol oxidase polypeptide I family protein, partial [Vibrio parahaemolyticus V-223/04]
SSLFWRSWFGCITSLPWVLART